MSDDLFSAFSDPVRDWFRASFAAPTRAQELGWPPIAAGDHTLLLAPTGSGKTLAAFLSALDGLVRDPSQRGTRVLYVSPLKALNQDIERSRRAPAAGIAFPRRPSIAVRSGDTPQSQRAAIRREPPDILITTPESLYLMLTSGTREVLRTVETVIVDEIHAVAATKRGTHLSLSLERLDHLAGRTLQRVGLSATQRPPDGVARFLGGDRDVTIVDAGASKELDLEVVVPVDDMRELGAAPAVEGEPRQSIWPAVYPALLDLVRAHRSTIVFVNNRRSAERMAIRLNELARSGSDAGASQEIARAHHGSLAREERLVVEEMLKSGELPCLVAPSSLELGIDMGAVDLVLQIESPKSVSRGLQRIGRAGHSVGDVSKGKIFPKFRADLLECAVVVRRMREGAIEETVVPRNPLDVLAEEIVYEARAGQTFLLGATTWRIEEIGRDRVVVTPAPGLPGAVPFWKGDGVGRPKELGEAIGAFARWAVDQPPAALSAGFDLDERAARNLVEFLGEQQAATRVLPSDRTVVIERFRDEIGDWRLCILSPYGGRVHAAWGLALSARIRDELGLESDAIWSDDGIVVHLPDADEPPGLDLILIDPEEVEDRVVAELASSALFGARFRENAGRALLIPRARPGKRTPLWQQRLKSQSLLEVAKKYDDFPIVLETYRECLRDVLDVPGLVDLLTRIHRRGVSLVEVETPTASPFASSLLFYYVATYMYEGDTPNAERRAGALSLDRELLRELLGQEELRELIDPGALEQVELDLQHRSDRTRPDSRDG